jgi:uroporphyrinogen-III synthase
MNPTTDQTQTKIDAAKCPRNITISRTLVHCVLILTIPSILQQIRWPNSMLNNSGIVVVESYIIPLRMKSFIRNHPTKTTTSRRRNSNDDDDDDNVDRNMDRIGWGKTVLSEALLSTTATEEYVLPESKFENDKRSASKSKSDTTEITIGIALTREEGKNDALASRITSCTQLMRENQYNVILQAYEIPCIQHADGPDYQTLKDILYQQATNDNPTTIYDYIIITSPEAARVLASVWPWKENTSSLSSPPKVAAVGKATELTLRECGIDVAFVPSKATAQILVQELPPIQLENTKQKTNVLYPASAKAADVIVQGLENRTTFSVSRLDTYDTIASTWNATQQEMAQQCQIVTFASPSAIKGWLSNIEKVYPGTNPNAYIAACIGETSASACRKLGWDDSRIFYPKEQPGMDGWVDAIMVAATTIAADTNTMSSTQTTTPTTATTSAGISK